MVERYRRSNYFRLETLLSASNTIRSHGSGYRTSHNDDSNSIMDLHTVTTDLWTELQWAVQEDGGGGVHLHEVRDISRLSFFVRSVSLALDDCHVLASNLGEY